ncbi:hypothetical protein Tco_1077668 [Tanacetum coccineum]
MSPISSLGGVVQSLVTSSQGTDKANPQENVKTGQTRTRETEEQQAAERGSYQRARRTIQVVEYTLAEINVSHEPSLVNPKKECHVGLKKAQEKGYFALILLSKEAQKSINHGIATAGDPCEAHK